MKRPAKLEPCEICGQSLEPVRHRYRRGLSQWLADSADHPRSAQEKIEAAFTVRCPHCGCTYVSSIVRGTLGLTFPQYKVLLLTVLASVFICMLGATFGWFGL